MSESKKRPTVKTSEPKPKKEAPKKETPKTEEVNPVGRPREIAKITSNDGLMPDEEETLNQIAGYMQVTPSQAVKAALKFCIWNTPLRGVPGVANQLMPHR